MPYSPASARGFLKKLLNAIVFVCPFWVCSIALSATETPTPRPIESSQLASHPNLSVAFSAADLSNPESVFGHVFIVFHHGDRPGPMDPVIEFYGMMSQVDMGMLKTVVSDIPGIYKRSTFGEKVRSYDIEGRDLFVRRAHSSVSAPDIAEKVASLSSRLHPYDFLDRNCAFYLEYLLTSSPSFSESAWSIRQPSDVFYQYGDPKTEYAIISTDRSRMEFAAALSSLDSDSPPSIDEDLRKGLDFHTARSVVLKAAVGTPLDASAVEMFKQSPPPSPFFPPASSGPRKYVQFGGGGDMFSLAYGGFDTRGISTLDAIPSLSRLKVGEVSLSCKRNQSCVSQVLAFETLTLPKDGFGLSKFISSAGRHDRDGLALNIQVGFGIGYRSGGFGMAVIPELAIDTKQWGRRDSIADGLLANRFVLSYLHKDSLTYFDITVSDSAKLSNIDQDKESLKITSERFGLFVESSFSGDFLVGFQKRFD